MANDKPATLQTEYLTPEANAPKACDLQLGTVFRTFGYEGPGFYIVVSPGGLLNKSTTVISQVNRGRVLTHNTWTHKICFIDPLLPVEVFNKAVLTIE